MVSFLFALKLLKEDTTFMAEINTPTAFETIVSVPLPKWADRTQPRKNLLGEGTKMTWEGRGSRIEQVGPRKSRIIKAFVFDRIELGDPELWAPRVVRTFTSKRPNDIEDAVFYPQDPDPKPLCFTYRPPKRIEDVDQLMQYGWHNYYSFETKDPEGYYAALIDVVFGEVGTIREYSAPLGRVSLANIGRVDLCQAGTPPIYPTR